ncbi:hypothetical protein [Paenibacillus soyae]|uniref:Uncharacterized protein n=1 Tax=Paenibacillus soyae TaxID=2969249 RepID=A0A9X2SB88_9BACL|nr:hypothetical protein [Paenibacillus soyae]MCR2805403.1 hypothetical protein [Paenibacillus soyae]
MNSIKKGTDCLENSIVKPTVEEMKKQELVCVLADLIRKYAVHKMTDTN